MFMHTFEVETASIISPLSSPRIARISHTHSDPSWSYAFHVHTHGVELMYIAGGEAEIHINQRVFQAREGDIFLINKGVSHSIASSQENPSDIWCCLLENVEFTDEDQIDYSLITTANSGSFWTFIDQCFHMIYDFSYQKEEYGSTEVCNHLAVCLLVIFRQIIMQSDLEGPAITSDFAQDVLLYINENYEKPITLESLAKTFFTSSSCISREFKKAFDMSPINYLIDKRLSEAKWLLINTNETVRSIADRVGYPNPYYFAKLFAKKTGFQPSDYRQKFGEKEI